MLRLLIDECLSARLVRRGHAAGHDAIHVVERGWSQWPDHQLSVWCVENSYVVVTLNGRDFRRLLGREPIHPGLVYLIHAEGTQSLAEQEQLFDRFLAYVVDREQGEDLTNTIVEVRADSTREYERPPLA